MFNDIYEIWLKWFFIFFKKRDFWSLGWCRGLRRSLFCICWFLFFEVLIKFSVFIIFCFFICLYMEIVFVCVWYEMFCIWRKLVFLFIKMNFNGDVVDWLYLFLYKIVWVIWIWMFFFCFKYLCLKLNLWCIFLSCVIICLVFVSKKLENFVWYFLILVLILDSRLCM